MGKRPRPKFSGANPLDAEDASANILSPAKADSAIYSANRLAIAPSGNIVAHPIALSRIQRDPTQPRRAIPARVLEGVKVDTDIHGLLTHWHQIAEEILGASIDVSALINKQGNDNDDDQQVTPGIVRDLLELIKLAGEIKRDGLTYAITVIEQGNTYKIETGERRWLAYHLLYLVTGESQWDAIPAVIQDKGGSIWRTASENAVRQDLNAIARARQFANIVMYLNQERFEYLPYESFVHDREYYAQVADGNVHKIPRDQSQAVSDVTGIVGYARKSQIRSILSLPNDVWDIADEESWKDDKIRQYLSGTLKVFKVNPPAPPTENPYMGQFWTFYDKIAKKNTQIAGRVGEAERRQMADALRKLADDLERTKK